MILDLEEQDFNLTLSSFEIFKTKVLEASALLQRAQAGAAVEVARGPSDRSHASSNNSEQHQVSKSSGGSLGTSSSSGLGNQTLTSAPTSTKAINLLNNTI